MSSDIEFSRQRLARVEQEIAHPSEYQYVGHDRGRSRRNYLKRQNTTYEREARLLRKLLTRARPGNALHLLTTWRRELGEFAGDHRIKHREAMRAYDEWCYLPPHVQARVQAPPKPPVPRFVDHDGAPWIVDDGLLALLDDLIERLRKWLDEDTRS
jgi:hypothetical protein